MLRWPVIYIHGLNTYGDDLIHVGPWSGAYMDQFWLRELAQRNVHAFGLRGWAAPRFTQLLENAETAFTKLVSEHNHQHVHLIGHSMGGLLARHLRNKYPNVVQTVTTLATPHRGSRIAEYIFSGANRRSEFARKRYLRHEHFQALNDLTPNSLKTLFPWGTEEEEREGQFVYTFAIEEKELSKPVLIVQKVLNLKFEGDGFVELESQKWGRHKDPIALDHMDQIGLFMHLNPRKRRLKKERFRLLIDDIVDHIRQWEKEKSTF